MGNAKASRSTEVSDKSWFWITFVFLITTVTFVIYAYKMLKRPEIILPVLLVLGVVVLVISLAFISVVFKSLKLSDRNQSLGLPEGSVRAVIALSLILVFMMSAVFLYTQVDNPLEYKSIITKEILDTMPQDEIVEIRLTNETWNNESLYEVTRIVDKNSANTDIAKQIITTMSTLVVAVAAFYFGTKSVSVAKSLTEEPEEPPVLSAVNPGAAAKGDELDLQIAGELLDSVKEARLIQGSEIIGATDVTVRSSNLVTCHVAIPEDKPEGTYAVVVITADKKEIRRDDAFTVNPKG